VLATLNLQDFDTWPRIGQRRRRVGADAAILIGLILLLNRFVARARNTHDRLGYLCTGTPSIARRPAADRRAATPTRRLAHCRLRAARAVLLIALFPPYFMTITAFHPPTLSFNRTPTLFSTDLTLSAFVDLFTKFPYLTWMANTAIVSVSSTIFS